MKSLMKPQICVFLVLVLLFEVFGLITPVSAKTSSFPAPVITVKKHNNDLGIKVTINKTKKAQGYEIYVCPVKTIPLYKGYAGDSFYVDGNSVNKLDGSWHDKGSFYKQAEISSFSEDKYDYYIDFLQSGTYKIKVRAFFDTSKGTRKYSKYSKTKKVTIQPGEGGKGLKESYDLSSLNVGDEFEFGTYEQDGNLKNGYEPIKWRILSKNDDNIFVISKYVLDILPYNKEYADTTWEDSTLREWLNNKFFDAAFNNTEKKLIKEMTLTNEDNAIYGTNGGNPTTDNIFILSQNDLKNSSYGFSSDLDEKDINRRCAATRYAISAGSGMYFDYTTEEGLGTCYWWVRTPGYEADYGTFVHDYGNVISDGNNYDFGYVYYCHGVRPCMFIKLDNQKIKPAGNVTIQQAMDEIADRLVGKFFTVSGDECDSCKGSFKSGHGCSNCLVSKIVKQEWYKKLFPEFKEVDASHFPNIASGNKDSSYDNDGKSCFGFGCWAQWYVYSRVYGEQNFIGQHHFAKGKMTYEFLQESGAMPGDVIRKDGSHTMLLYSYDKDGYIVIDSNGHHNGNKNCVVAKVTMNYDKKKTCVLSRPKIS